MEKTSNKQLDLFRDPMESPLSAETTEPAIENKKQAKTKPQSNPKTIIDYLRDVGGKIEYYTFKIFVRNKPALEGKLTRADMDLIHRYYSNYGSKLTQREVSRYFPQYSLIDFRKILAAFNITKSSAPFPLHVTEECTEEQIKEMVCRERENNVLVALEQEQIKRNADLVREQTKELLTLKKSQNNIEKIAKDFFKAKTPDTFFTPTFSGEAESTLILHIADAHIGAKVESDSLYENNYNIDIIKNRLNNLLLNIKKYQDVDNVIINFLGDMLDGYDMQTCRRDHILPQNMNNFEQIKVFLEVFEEFFVKLLCIFKPEQINVFSVKCGNHDGAYSYSAMQTLFTKLKYHYCINNTVLFDQFFGKYEVGNNVFLVCHGKDEAYMKKGFPLQLDDKTRGMIYDWLDENKITGENIHFIKGDLHQDNINTTYKMSYRNVLSLFGSSDYSMMNYQRVKRGVSYELIIDGDLLRGQFTNLG